MGFVGGFGSGRTTADSQNHRIDSSEYLSLPNCHFPSRLPGFTSVRDEIFPNSRHKSTGNSRGREADEDTERILPITRERMSRTAGSGEPKDSARLFSKGAAIFLVGGNESPRWVAGFCWVQAAVPLRLRALRNHARRFLSCTTPVQCPSLTSFEDCPLILLPLPPTA